MSNAQTPDLSAVVKHAAAFLSRAEKVANTSTLMPDDARSELHAAWLRNHSQTPNPSYPQDMTLPPGMLPPGETGMSMLEEEPGMFANLLSSAQQNPLAAGAIGAAGLGGGVGVGLLLRKLLAARKGA